MKKLSLDIFSVILSSCLICQGTGAQTLLPDVIRWQDRPTATIVADSAGIGGVRRCLELTFTLDSGLLPEVAAQNSVELIPVIESYDGSRDFSFPPIYIDGQIRAKAIDRMSVLSGIDRPEGSLVLRPDSKNGTGDIEYLAQIPYDPAMVGGRFLLYGRESGCAGCTEKSDTLEYDNILPPYSADWKFTPSPASGKKHGIIRESADIKFVVNKYDILPDWQDNEDVLAKIIASLQSASDTTMFRVTSVSFIGYASPDGPEDFNRELARNRARSLTEYVKETDEIIPDSLFRAESVGENWEGLFTAAATDPNISGNSIINEIRGSLSEDNWQASERKLKSDAKLYDYLRKNILPSLRRTEYSIEYEIRNFKAEEAKGLWQTRPDVLSVDEFMSAAELYGKDSPEYLQVILKAEETYPEDISALNNAAIALYDAGRLTEAAAMLDGTDSPLLLNTLGIILASEKDYEGASEYFKESAAGGNAEAAHNMKELEEILYQL